MADSKAKKEDSKKGATSDSRSKKRRGIVLKNKMDKSVVVAVVQKVRHPLYGKYVTRTKRYMAHDESNDCGLGDSVEIMETRPLSKHKRWKVTQVLERAV